MNVDEKNKITIPNEEEYIAHDEMGKPIPLTFDTMCEHKKAWNKIDRNVVVITPFRSLGQIVIEYIEISKQLNTYRQVHKTLNRESFPVNCFYAIKDSVL